jgi:hypothetical protein
MDPGAFGVGAPDMAQLLARSRAPVTLARGEHDAMSTSEQLARLGVPRSRSRAWATTHTSRTRTCRLPCSTHIADTGGQPPARSANEQHESGTLMAVPITVPQPCCRRTRYRTG